MRIFKNTWFSRFADREGITDDELREAVNRLEKEQTSSDLGGGVFKVRVARSGEGKSGGYRVIVFFKSEKRTFYHYAYSKSDRANINEKELWTFKQLARKYLSMSEEDLVKALKVREFIEIIAG